MKTLIVILAVMVSFTSVAADLNIQPGTGNIIESGEIELGNGLPNLPYEKTVGNIMDMYSIEKDLRRELQDGLECSNAMAAAAMSAKPVAFDQGMALGVGLGGSGNCGALAVGFDYMMNDTLSYNVHLSKGLKSTAGTDAVVGAGVHYRF